MAWQEDPLLICSTKRVCPQCGGERRKRRGCQPCHGSGFQPADLAGLWAPRPAFMVCGGPSLATLPVERLRERGVVSLAINNAGAFAPVKAHTFGDPQTKFHSAQMMDPAVISFVPFGKLRYPIQIKHEGQFWRTSIRPCDCPNVWGISRSSTYGHTNFLTHPSAHWGEKHKPLETQPGKRSKLCTMLMGLRLLHYLGASRIYLLGVDFDIPPKGSDKPGYAWGDAASAGNRIWDDKIDPMMRELRPVFEQAGVSIFNCNESSKCSAFEYVSFADAMADCKGPVEDEPLDLHQWYDKKLAEEHHKLHPEPLDEAAIRALRGRPVIQCTASMEAA